MTASPRDVYMIHVGPSGSVFVKALDFFREQGGFRDEWGMAWRPVIATSIEDARRALAEGEAETVDHSPQGGAATEMYKALKGIDTFAWSAVKADCEESRGELMKRITACREALISAASATPPPTEQDRARAGEIVDTWQTERAWHMHMHAVHRAALVNAIAAAFAQARGETTAPHAAESLAEHLRRHVMPDESWEHVAESALAWLAQARGAGGRLVEAARPFGSGRDWGRIKAWLVEGAPTREAGIIMARGLTALQVELDAALAGLDDIPAAPRDDREG